MNWAFLNQTSFSQKRVLWILVGIAIMLAAYNFLVAPLVEAKKSGDQEIALNRRLLAKYTEILKNREAVEEALEKTVKMNGEIQKRLLPGETSQLGAANLQDIVKRLAEKNNMSLRSFRNLDPKEVGSFRKVSMQINFTPMSSMASLTQFLYDLENQDRELMISEMDLLVFNPRMPQTIQGNMIISGWMKGNKGKDKEKGR